MASTLAYIAIFALLRVVTGAQAANLLALLITATGNTAANRRLTFGVTGRHGAGRHQVQGLVVFGLGLAPGQCRGWDPQDGKFTGSGATSTTTLT